MHRSCTIKLYPNDEQFIALASSKLPPYIYGGTPYWCEATPLKQEVSNN
ncbi:MAG: hypothetical protein HAW61_01835 [Candidatus Portiera sp.]|nr:hypothetical protein [Portiera sp.]